MTVVIFVTVRGFHVKVGPEKSKSSPKARFLLHGEMLLARFTVCKVARRT